MSRAVITPADAEIILGNPVLCRSVRRLYATGEHSLHALAGRLRAGAARRRMPMSASEALVLVDYIVEAAEYGC